MIYQIFRNSIEVVQVEPLDNSELSQKKQSEDIIRLKFTLNDFIDVKIGDYIAFEKTNQIYVLNKKPRITESPKNYKYECIFEGSIHELKKTKVLLTTPKEQGGDYKDYKFPLTGNAQTFLDFIVLNLNQNSSGYTAGKYKETETKTIQFNNWDAAQAVFEISNQLGFGWYLEGKELNFDEKNFNTAYTFQVGRKVGFTELTRTRVASEDLETVVYGYGSSNNLPPRTAEEGITYDGDLLTENRLSFEGEKGESKLEKNVDLYGRIESIQEFDIKPERIGIVTGVDLADLRSFFDTDIDFDINDQLLAGIKPKINFLSGTLLGLNFDIAFENSTKKITIDYYADEAGQYPNSIQKSEIGDTYVLFDLIMPESYIVDASQRLEQATQDYIDKQSKGLESYTGKIDEEFIQANDIVLNLGDLIRIVSTTFFIDNLYEIKDLIQNLNNPAKYTIKFGDVLPKSLIGALKVSNFNQQQQFYNIERNVYTTTEVNNQTTNIVNEQSEWEEL